MPNTINKRQNARCGGTSPAAAGRGTPGGARKTGRKEGVSMEDFAYKGVEEPAGDRGGPDASIRRRTEELEAQILSAYAARSAESKGRSRPEAPCAIRTDFQRDRDRIVHCKAFRRLKHKTQVFLSPEGDHYRTRLTHTLEVSQIARTIARALRLNEDLTEAIALGHDLGHTPFGHAGERALRECSPLGFQHYEQSVRVCQRLEKAGRGLNLTYEVLNGIQRHTNGPQADTLEGRVVRLSDRIAYINHDIDDAVRAGVLGENDIPFELRHILGNTKSQRIDAMVRSVIESSGADVRMGADIQPAFDALHAFLYDAVYLNPKAKGEEGKVGGLIQGLYGYFTAHPGRMPDEYAYICEAEGPERAALDYIAGMTDPYAVQTYTDIFIPKRWEI